MRAPLKDSVVVFLVVSGGSFVPVFNGLTKERKFITVFIALDLSVGVFSIIYHLINRLISFKNPFKLLFYLYTFRRYDRKGMYLFIFRVFIFRLL